ncbi:MAG: hypothetical protein QW735_00085 [archaeon]
MSVDTEKIISEYLAIGGIIKRSDSGEIIYPTRRRLQSQINLLTKKASYFDSQIRFYEKKKKEIRGSSIVRIVSSKLDLIYWKHIFKLNFDKDYRAAYEELKPPIDKLSDPQIKKIMSYFINNKEYRDRLLEAKQTLNRDSLSEEFQAIFEDKLTFIENNIKRLESEKNKLLTKIKILEKMLNLVP